MQKILKINYVNLSLTQYAIIYILLAGLTCHMIEIPEIVKSFLALPGFIVIPFVCGDIITNSSFFILAKYRKLPRFIDILIKNLDNLSLCVLRWCLGSLLLFTLTTMIDLFFKFNFSAFYCTVVLILLMYLLLSFCYTRHNSACKIMSDYKGKAVLIIPLITLIGLSPILWFKLYSIFPLQYYNPSFVIHSHQILRIIENNLLNYTIESYLPYFYLLFAIISEAFNVHPYSLFWTFPFIGSPLWALGLFYLTKKMTNKNTISILTASLGSYLFSGGYFISNFMITQRGLEIILFPFLIYFIICVVEIVNNTAKEHLTFTKIFAIQLLVVTPFLPITFIGFQRVIEGDIFFYKNMLIKACIMLLLFTSFIFLQKLKCQYIKTLFFSLFLTMFTLWIIHMTDSWMAFLTLAFFLLFLNLNLKNMTIGKLICITVASLLFIWIYLQKVKIITLPANFFITDLLLRGAYEGSKYQVDFNFKYSIFTRTFPEIFFLMFVAASILFAVTSYKYKHIPYILSASSVGSLGLLIFFLPDPVLYRISGYFAPFVIVTVSCGLLRVIFKNKFIARLSKNILIPILSLILIILAFPLAVNSFYDYSMYKVSVGITDKLINEAPYEYEAAKWLKHNFPIDTFVISDIWTRRYIIGLTNFVVTDKDNPWDRLRFDETSFKVIPSYEHFARQMKIILSEDNSCDIYCHVKNLTKSKNIIIVISGRTEAWVNKKDLGFENDIHPGVNNDFLSKFMNKYYFTPLHSIDNKIYIFGVNPEPGKPFEIKR